MTISRYHKLLGLLVLASALLAAACASGDDESAGPTTTSTAAPSAPSTVAESNPQATATASDEELPMSEEIDPAGTVEGGTVVRTYVADEFPQELSGIIGGMIADLSARLEIEATAIRVVAVDDVTWSDGSLGCPQPGMSYAQVTTDGMRVILEAKAVFYDYRADGVRDPFLCEHAAVTEKSSGPLLKLTEEGVIRLDPPENEGSIPTEGNNPPDE